MWIGNWTGNNWTSDTCWISNLSNLYWAKQVTKFEYYDCLLHFYYIVSISWLEQGGLSTNYCLSDLYEAFQSSNLKYKGRMVKHERHLIFTFHTYFLKALMYKLWFLNIILHFHYKLEYLLTLSSLYMFKI